MSIQLDRPQLEVNGKAVDWMENVSDEQYQT
jgi:hypothetical protein